MRGSTFKQRWAAFRRGVLRRPLRVLALLGVVVAGVAFDRLVLTNGDVWGAVGAMGIGSWLVTGWMLEDFRRRPERSPGGPGRPAGAR